MAQEMTTAARKQELRTDAMNQDDVHTALSNLPPWAVLRAVEAHIQARPDLSAKTLREHADRMSRLAWEMERDPDRQ